MKINDNKIKDILLLGNYISKEDAEAIEQLLPDDRSSFGQCALDHGHITKDLVGQAVAETYGVPYADLNSYIPTKEKVLSIPRGVAQKYRVVWFAEEGSALTVASDTPMRKGLLSAIKKVFPKKKKVTIAYSLTEDVDMVLGLYQDPLQKRIDRILAKEESSAPQILDEIFSEALASQASDIHLEPFEEDFRIRLRVDGMMREVGRLGREHYDSLLNRIKIKSRMRIDEHFAAQDGAMRYEQADGVRADVRVSVIPSLTGEKVAMRLLAEYVQGFTFRDIGLSEEDSSALATAVKKPFGLVLVVGPTGSGKTTTLYTLLKILNDPAMNITTIEDPVEYRIHGVNQIKVNEVAGLTFARGLRSIVRQDPDVILVGEIRDAETAEIAINAALTGHLVLSTFHANDAATAIPRLLDMGVEPFLLASTLELIVGQRLVRRLSEECRQSRTIGKKTFTKEYPGIESYMSFNQNNETTIYEDGCTATGQGFRGRKGIFELIQMTPKLKEAVLQRPSASEVWEIARAEGATSLFEDGLRSVAQGDTTLDELLRVAEPPQNTYVRSPQKDKKK